MARLLKPFDAGFAALTAGLDAPAEPLVFGITDWRFELGSLGTRSHPLRFDPAVCGFDPASMGFVAGWTENPV
jgi:hypothetical protein